MQFIKEFENINIKKLQKYLKTYQQSFKKESHLDNFISNKFSIKDPILFDISQEILNDLALEDKFNSYHLVRNDIKHTIMLVILARNIKIIYQ